MAYKNKKANKRHIKAKRIKDGDVRFKYLRAKDRKYKGGNSMSLEEMEAHFKKLRY